jgi:hypothetical protein
MAVERIETGRPVRGRRLTGSWADVDQVVAGAVRLARRARDLERAAADELATLAAGDRETLVVALRAIYGDAHAAAAGNGDRCRATELLAAAVDRSERAPAATRYLQVS